MSGRLVSYRTLWAVKEDRIGPACAERGPGGQGNVRRVRDTRDAVCPDTNLRLRMAMRHRKRAPALFEVIRSTGGGTAAVIEERRPLFRFPRLSFGRRLTSPGFGVVDAAPPVAEFAPSDA